MISMSLRPDSVAKSVIWRVILAFTYASMVWAFLALAQSMIYTNSAMQHHQQMVNLVIGKGSDAQYGTLCILAASVLLATYIHLNLSVGPQERLRLLKIRAHFLARVFPLQRELRDQILLGDLLVSGGFIDETQLERALNLSRLNGKVLSQTLVTCGWVEDHDIIATVELRQKILNREISQSGAWAMMKACRAAIELHNDLSFAPVASAPASRTTFSAGVRDTVVNMESHRRSRIVKSAEPEKIEPVGDRGVDKQRSFLPFVRKVDVAQTVGAKLANAVDCTSAPMMLPAAQEYAARTEEFPSVYMSDSPSSSRNSRLERGIQALKQSRNANKIQAVLKCLTFDELQSMEELVTHGADREDSELKQADDVEFIEPALSFAVGSFNYSEDGRELVPIVDELQVEKVSDASIERKMQSQSHSISVGVTDGRIVPSGVRSVDEGRIVPSRVCFVDGTGVCIVAEYCDE